MERNPEEMKRQVANRIKVLAGLLADQTSLANSLRLEVYVEVSNASSQAAAASFISVDSTVRVSENIDWLGKESHKAPAGAAYDDLEKRLIAALGRIATDYEREYHKGRRPAANSEVDLYGWTRDMY